MTYAIDFPELAIDDSDDPLDVDATPQDMIAALPGLKCFLMPYADLITTSGGHVTSITDRAGLIGTIAQATAGYQPAWTASDAGINGRPFMTFDGGDGLILGNLLPVSGQPWTKVAIVRAPAEATTYRHIASSAASLATDGCHALAIRNVNQIAQRIDIAPDQTNAFIAYTPATWLYTVASFDGVGTARIRVNHVTGSPFTDADAGTRVSQRDVCLGNQTPGGPGGFIGDLALFAQMDGEYLATANAAWLKQIDALVAQFFNL